MKIKFRRGQYLGDKIVGFIYSECYSLTVYGIMFWSYGLFLTIGEEKRTEQQCLLMGAKCEYEKCLKSDCAYYDE